MKTDFTRRYKLGEFGNASPTWDTLEEFKRGGYTGHVHIRNRAAGGRTWYNIPGFRVVNMVKALRKQAIPVDTLYFSAMAPHHCGTIQGEVTQDERGLYLLWTSAKKPMREALAEFSNHAWRASAWAILRHYLCPNSFDWLLTLFDRYPHHVIEFSSFNKCWGTVPRHNTVFWEVRHY